MTRVVIDTSVLVSAVISPTGPNACIVVKSGGRLTISSHEDDNRIYECAAAAKADYIVTENTKHFKKPYKATRIVSARQLLRLLVAQGHAMPP
jgi:predicted nucleic acid-binding protein